MTAAEKNVLGCSQPENQVICYFQHFERRRCARLR
jgi:hypothetical protein